VSILIKSQVISCVYKCRQYTITADTLSPTRCIQASKQTGRTAAVATTTHTSSVDYANNPYNTVTSALLKLQTTTLTVNPPEIVVHFLSFLYTHSHVSFLPLPQRHETADPPTITTQSRPKDLHFLVGLAGSREPFLIPGLPCVDLPWEGCLPL